jgi:hypothetical protein
MDEKIRSKLKCKTPECGKMKQQNCDGYCMSCFGQDPKNKDAIEQIYEELNSSREDVNLALKLRQLQDKNINPTSEIEVSVSFLLSC